LIFLLKNANREARRCKLVAVGVGTIAAGVAKAKQM
jgi:glutamate synthase domain-containing protein 2